MFAGFPRYFLDGLSFLTSVFYCLASLPLPLDVLLESA